MPALPQDQSERILVGGEKICRIYQPHRLSFRVDRLRENGIQIEHMNVQTDKSCYPEYDNTQRWAKVPSQGLNDLLADALKEDESKKRAN